MGRRTDQGWTTGLAASLALHGMALAGVLAWRAAPVGAPADWAIEIVEDAPSVVAAETAVPSPPLAAPVVEAAAAQPVEPLPVPADLPLAMPAPAVVAVATPAPVRRPVARPAAGAAAPVSTGAVSAPATPGAAEAAAWRSLLLAWVETHKTYPAAARARGIEGVVTVRVEVVPSGRVAAVALLASSGAGILDEAVRRLLDGAEVPPLPAGWPEPARAETLRIGFALR